MTAVQELTTVASVREFLEETMKTADEIDRNLNAHRYNESVEELRHLREMLRRRWYALNAAASPAVQAATADHAQRLKNDTPYADAVPAQELIERAEKRAATG